MKRGANTCLFFFLSFYYSISALSQSPSPTDNQATAKVGPKDSFGGSATRGAGLFDTLQAAFSQKPRPVAGFATKSTFINGFRSPIFTARVGADFNNRVRLGLGISWLWLSGYENGKNNIPHYLDKSFTDSSGPHTVHPELQFRYINIFFDYVYYRSGRWQFSIPIQFGIGDSRYYYNFNGENIYENKKGIFLYEPAVSGQYKIIKWFGVGLDVGYRIMIVTNKQIGTRFNSPVYDIKALIFWGELYRTVFVKK